MGQVRASESFSRRPAKIVFDSFWVGEVPQAEVQLSIA